MDREGLLLARWRGLAFAFALDLDFVGVAGVDSADPERVGDEDEPLDKRYAGVEPGERQRGGWRRGGIGPIAL